MAESTPQNLSSKPVGATNRPQNYGGIQNQVVGPQSGDSIISALENTPRPHRGSRNQPSVMKYPDAIGQSEVPHVMQFKIFWRWERPDLANRLDGIKEESKNNVEALQNSLSTLNTESSDFASEVLNDQRVSKVIDQNNLRGLFERGDLEGWEARSVLEETLKSEQAKVDTISKNRSELLGKLPPDSDERLALRSGVNEQLANLNPLEAGAKAGGVASLFQAVSTFRSSTGTVGSRLKKATISGAKTGLIVGAGTAVATALAKYTQASPVYDQMVSIYLPMCTKINQTDVFSYKEANMAVAGGLMDILGGPMKESFVQGVQGLGTKVADTKGLGDAVSAFTGTVINPRLEKIFQEKGIRTFTFAWDFYPRNPVEVENIKAIIDTFRYHSHPAISMSSDSHKDATPEQKQAHTKIMLRVPAEFEVRFLSSSPNSGIVGYNENEYIPKVGRCVITDIQADYTPNGVFSTFQNNAPTAVTLILTMSEVTQMTREHVEAGY